jgi:hypothetical protein
MYDINHISPPFVIAHLLRSLCSIKQMSLLNNALLNGFSHLFFPAANKLSHHIKNKAKTWSRYIQTHRVIMMSLDDDVNLHLPRCPFAAILPRFEDLEAMLGDFHEVLEEAVVMWEADGKRHLIPYTIIFAFCELRFSMYRIIARNLMKAITEMISLFVKRQLKLKWKPLP